MVALIVVYKRNINIMCYVEGLTFFGKNERAFDSREVELNKRFWLKYLEKSKHCVDMQSVWFDDGSIGVRPTSLVIKALEVSFMSKAKLIGSQVVVADLVSVNQQKLLSAEKSITADQKSVFWWAWSDLMLLFLRNKYVDG